MNDYQKYVRDIFKEMKRTEPESEFRLIPILDDEHKTIAFLKPITFDYRNIFPDCISIMSRWRKEFPSLANTIFEVTDKRTEYWMDNLVLRNEDRLFFFIDDLQGNHLGHIALAHFDYEQKNGQIENVVHGERGNIHNLMYYSILALRDWLCRVLLVDTVYMMANTDNTRAYELYQRCGFQIIGRVPLFKKELPDEVRWDEDSSRDEADADRFQYKMAYINNYKNK